MKTITAYFLFLLAAGIMPVFAQADDSGDGTFKAPYVLNNFADSGDGILLRVTGLERPADQMVGDLPPPGAGEEYVIVFVEVQCAASRSDNCQVDSYDMELAGDHGLIYPFGGEWAVNLDPGDREGKALIALINSDDANLVLLFYHFPTIPYTFPLVLATQELPEASLQIPINATTGMIARIGPAYGLDFTGVFNRGEQVLAHGRNADGSWLEIQFGWVPTEWVETEGDIMNLPVTG